MSLAAMWAALGEDDADLDGVRQRGPEVPLNAVLPVGQFVHDAIAAASLSAGLLAANGSGGGVPTVDLDPIRIATAVTSERHFRLHGKPMDAWAELSGFWPAADGWVRTHANYPHHRKRLLGALGLPESTGATELRAVLATRPCEEIELVVCGAGGIATAVRSEEQWRMHPHAGAVAALPLIGIEGVGDGPASSWLPGGSAAPASGVRVLDLTRVIAGPVAGRTLAFWGADVLRVDPPGLPEIAWQHLDTGAGKRSTVLAADAAQFGE
ncbi:MAG: CoA transferase, partial [Rhodoglobus sp.]|nr:CoA transferase [Rhodoglobus sp.]